MCAAFICVVNIVCGQGYNHQWLLGYWELPTDPKGRFYFDLNGYQDSIEYRDMSFYGSQANISDANGNFLMSTNGAWIANANNDTMLNGDSLNPGVFANNWQEGFPINYMNVVLPFPDDSNKYFLVHQTLWNHVFPAKSGIYLSKIDMTLDNGLGGVTSKNDTILADTLSMGIGACRHANGRDWWVVVMRDINPVLYSFLITPQGVDTMFVQPTNFIANTLGNVSHIVFSPNGDKFMYSTPINQTISGDVLIGDFDRCSGLISNLNQLPISQAGYLYDMAFSPSGQYAYVCNWKEMYQIDVNALTFQLIDTFDGFISWPQFGCCQTSFFGLYLAANGKIYGTSGSGTKHLHEMHNPDSPGIACNFVQHAIELDTGIAYAQLRSVPNHPNYYLGCDTTSGCPCYTAVNDLSPPDFKFRVYPNPVVSGYNGASQVVNIGYQLPQNKNGLFQVYDVNGKVVFTYTLPPWSNEQSFKLPQLSAGLYHCVITSDGKRVGRKLAVVK
jgi:hypothetical protein